jgi:hypothetical protein
MAFQLSSVALPAMIASSAAKAAPNQGSSLRSSAVSRRASPVTVMPTAMVLGAIRASLADASWVPGHIQRREVRAGAVREQVQPVKTKVLAQRLDIIDKPVTAVGGGIFRYRGLAGAPRVHHDQPPMRRQPAEFTEVGGVLHRAARQADQQDSRPNNVVREVGPIMCGIGRHAEDPVSGTPTRQPTIPTSWTGSVFRNRWFGWTTQECREAGASSEREFPS